MIESRRERRGWRTASIVLASVSAVAFIVRAVFFPPGGLAWAIPLELGIGIVVVAAISVPIATTASRALRRSIAVAEAGFPGSIVIAATPTNEFRRFFAKVAPDSEPGVAVVLILDHEALRVRLVSEPTRDAFSIPINAVTEATTSTTTGQGGFEFPSLVVRFHWIGTSNQFTVTPRRSRPWDLFPASTDEVGAVAARLRTHIQFTS